MGFMDRSVCMKNQPDLDTFADKMTPAVERAAQIALSLEGRVVNTPKVEESTAVKQALTEADTRVQEEILEALYEHFPDVCLAAEEETPRVEDFQSGGDSLVIIDPIDGTLQSYLQKMGPYAVIVGLAVRREVRAALIALPREGFLFRGSREKGAEVLARGQEFRASAASSDGDGIYVSHNVPPEMRTALEAEGFRVVPACGGAVAVAPLVPGIRAGLRLAERRSQSGVSIRGRAGLAIAHEAGAVIRGERGEAFAADLDTPHWTLCVTADEDDQAILQRISRIQA